MSSPLYVVIPSHDRPDLAIRTLESLSRCVFPKSYKETVLVENGSRSDVLETYVHNASESFRLSYRHVQSGNKSNALNVVVADLPPHSVVVFFDDDVIVHPYALVAYAEAAEEHDEATYFGGPIFPDYARVPPAWLRHYLPSSVVGWSMGPLAATTRTTTFMGANWAARQHALLDAGLFDSAVGPGGTTGARGQETAMQRALLFKGGLGAYVPSAIVWHSVPEERCSPEWAISRAFALNKARSMFPSNSGTVTRYCRLLKEGLIAALFVAGTATVGPFLSVHKRFWLRFRLYSALGYLSGYRLLLRRDREAPRP